MVLIAGLVSSPGVVRAQDSLMVPRYLDLGLENKRTKQYNESIRYFLLAIAADSTYARAWLELGYVYNDVGRRPDALRAFEAGLRHDPRNVLAHRQLGYWLSEDGQFRASLAQFEAAAALGSDNTRDRLEVGLLKQRLGDREGALASYATAQASTDTFVSRRARESIASMTARVAPTAGTVAVAPPAVTVARGGGWIYPIFADIYATPLYQTRFDNAIVQATARAGFVLENVTSLSPYVSLRVTRDARSHGGLQPVIFSDNIAVPAAGIRLQPLKPLGLNGLYLYAEAGGAVELVDAGQAHRIRSDYRGGGFYIGQWVAGSAPPSDHTPLLLISDLYGDLTHFSRFENTIGYVQLRESLRVYAVGGRGVDLMSKLSLIGDTQDVYYNNAVELSGGVALYPDAARQVVIFIERIQGRYLHTPDAGVGRTYSDARVTFILSAYKWIGARTR